MSKGCPLGRATAHRPAPSEDCLWLWAALLSIEEPPAFQLALSGQFPPWAPRYTLFNLVASWLETAARKSRESALIVSAAVTVLLTYFIIAKHAMTRGSPLFPVGAVAPFYHGPEDTRSCMQPRARCMRSNRLPCLARARRGAARCAAAPCPRCRGCQVRSARVSAVISPHEAFVGGHVAARSASVRSASSWRSQRCAERHGFLLRTANTERKMLKIFAGAPLE